MLSSGMLEDRVVFLSPNASQNAYGEDVTTWEEVYRCRARVAYKKGSRALDCGEVWNPSAVSVTIRYTGKVNDRMRIRWNDADYHITSLNGSRMNGDVTITAERIQAEASNGD